MGICESKIEITYFSPEYIDDERMLSQDMFIGLTYTNRTHLIDPSGLKLCPTRQCLIYKDILYGLEQCSYDKEKNLINYKFENNTHLTISRDSYTFNGISYPIPKFTIDNYLPFNTSDATEFDFIHTLFKKGCIENYEYRFDE